MAMTLQLGSSAATAQSIAALPAQARRVALYGQQIEQIRARVGLTPEVSRAIRAYNAALVALASASREIEAAYREVAERHGWGEPSYASIDFPNPGLAVVQIIVAIAAATATALLGLLSVWRVTKIVNLLGTFMAIVGTLAAAAAVAAAVKATPGAPPPTIPPGSTAAPSLWTAAPWFSLGAIGIAAILIFGRRAKR